MLRQAQSLRPFRRPNVADLRANSASGRNQADFARGFPLLPTRSDMEKEGAREIITF